MKRGNHVFVGVCVHVHRVDGTPRDTHMYSHTHPNTHTRARTHAGGPTKKRSPNRLIVDEATNDDNSGARLVPRACVACLLCLSLTCMHGKSRDTHAHPPTHTHTRTHTHTLARARARNMSGCLWAQKALSRYSDEVDGLAVNAR